MNTADRIADLIRVDYENAVQTMEIKDQVERRDAGDAAIAARIRPMVEAVARHKKTCKQWRRDHNDLESCPLCDSLAHALRETGEEPIITCPTCGVTAPESQLPMPCPGEPQAEPSRCPTCGYTKADAEQHGDHGLCKNDGNAPWQASEPQAEPSKKGGAE